ncbi:MAG: hypothetical protein ACUZ8E_17310 [Candidatus Anammoxibacter sp.]
MAILTFLIVGLLMAVMFLIPLVYVCRWPLVIGLLVYVALNITT